MSDNKELRTHQDRERIDLNGICTFPVPGTGAPAGGSCDQRKRPDEKSSHGIPEDKIQDITGKVRPKRSTAL